MIQFYLKKLGFNFKLLDGSDFVKLWQVVDNVMKERSAKGLGRSVKKAKVLNDENIDQLWKSSVLGNASPKQLQDTVLFLLGYHCVLHAQKEHYNLRHPGFDLQISIENDGCTEYLKFTEDNNTKTNQGGLKHRKIANRIVCVYPAENTE